MAVTGLPTAVNNILATLLEKDHHLTSWKVTGDDSSTVVVLRLAATRPGDPQHTTQHGHWRRKPPGQVRRDKQRAAKHQQQLNHANNDRAASNTRLQDNTDCVNKGTVNSCDTITNTHGNQVTPLHMDNNNNMQASELSVMNSQADHSHELFLPSPLVSPSRPITNKLL